MTTLYPCRAASMHSATPGFEPGPPTLRVGVLPTTPHDGRSSDHWREPASGFTAATIFQPSPGLRPGITPLTCLALPLPQASHRCSLPKDSQRPSPLGSRSPSPFPWGCV